MCVFFLGGGGVVTRHWRPLVFFCFIAGGGLPPSAWDTGAPWVIWVEEGDQRPVDQKALQR